MSVTGNLESRNPLTLIEIAFWEMLESRADFCEMFPPNNRIKMRDLKRRDPVKSNIAAGDIPQVGVFPTNIVPRYHASSNSSVLTLVWEVRLLSDDIRPYHALIPSCFIVFRALADWEPTLGAIVWPLGSGKKPVKIVRSNGTLLGENMPEENKGVKGWAALWTGETEIWFDTADLKSAE